jgi:hypothetical protein
MNELPPDPMRLGVILRHLDAAIAENETVHTYLELQRRKVLDALSAAGGGVQQAAPTEAPATVQRPALREGPGSGGFMVDRVRTPDGPVAASVHMGDCHMVGPLARPLGAMEARVALVDEQLEACGFCRPDTELGIDVA